MKRFLMLMTGLVVLVGCERFEQQVETMPEKTYPVITVQKQAVRETVRGSGLVWFDKQIKLGFKTGGVIDAINVREGDRVASGALLASLDLDEIHAKVRQAELQLDKAQRDFRRAKALYEDSVATLEQFQDARSQLENVEAILEQAEFNLKFSKIHAPRAGRILKIVATENELIGPGYPVVLFGAEQGRVIKVHVPDRDVVRLNEGNTAAIRFDPFPEQTFDGRIREIAGVADPQTGAFAVTVEILDPPASLAAGFIGEVTLQSSRVDSLFRMPVTALIRANLGDAVFMRVENDTARRVKTRLRRVSETDVLVESGLNEGDRIIASGGEFLNDGDAVKTEPAADASRGETQ